MSVRTGKKIKSTLLLQRQCTRLPMVEKVPVVMRMSSVSGAGGN